MDTQPGTCLVVTMGGCYLHFVWGLSQKLKVRMTVKLTQAPRRPHNVLGKCLPR